MVLASVSSLSILFLSSAYLSSVSFNKSSFNFQVPGPLSFFPIDRLSDVASWSVLYADCILMSLITEDNCSEEIKNSCLPGSTMSILLRCFLLHTST